MKFYLIILFGFSIYVNGQSTVFVSSERLVLGNLKEKTASLDVGDIDNDGDQDIVVANGRHWPGQNRIFLNNGKGIFSVSKLLGNEN